MKTRPIPTDQIDVEETLRTDDDPEIDSLAMNILHHQQLQPIIVKVDGNRYRLIAGSRRLRAQKALGMMAVSATILEDVTEAEIAMIRLSENLVRKQLTLEETLRAVDAIKRKRGISDRQLSKELGFAESWIEVKRHRYNKQEALRRRGLSEEELEELGSKVCRLPADATADHARKYLNSHMHFGNPKRQSEKTKKRIIERAQDAAKVGSEVAKYGFAVRPADKHNILVMCRNKATKERILKLLEEARL